MFYNFPIINTIDDVLPHIADYKEFVVSKRDRYTVIDYVMCKNDTFDMASPDDIGGAIRRECRGLIFDLDGKLIRRPFHKFFNIGERVETMPNNLDMATEYVVYEKMDGSMISPFFLDNQALLGTKMGLTDIAADATYWLYNQPDFDVKYAFIKSWLRAGYTPIFEWVSPDNNIVVKYDKPNLVLLAMRNMTTGYYTGHDTTIFDTPKCYGKVARSAAGLKTYIEISRQDENREGDVFRWPGGHMVKGKNDWYVRIHKVKDKIRTYRHVLALMVNRELDDVKPLLDLVDVERITKYEQLVWSAFSEQRDKLNSDITLLIAAARAVCETHADVKRYLATSALPNSKFNKCDYGLVFGVADGKCLDDMLLAKFQVAINSVKAYTEFVEWLGLDIEKYK